MACILPARTVQLGDYQMTDSSSAHQLIDLRAGLPQFEAIGEGLAGADTGVRDAGQAGLINGHEQAAPVDAADLAQPAHHADTTSSPSRKRSTGPGIVPLIVMRFADLR